jgi:hypothetical protein
MNERILELAKISGAWDYFNDGDKSTIMDQQALQNFAELLITAVMAEVRDEVQYEYDWTIAEIVTERVKKAFGV